MSAQPIKIAILAMGGDGGGVLADWIVSLGEANGHIAQSECMLNRQRREKPQVKKAIAAGQRNVRERFGVDSDTCTGDHSCIRISGCPSLSIKPNPDPLRSDPVATVLDSCVGCGMCGEVSHAAVLCPSFYRADVVSNPNAWDRLRASLRQWLIGALQRRIERRLDATAF
jgi:indolepyruvate ferredoxin oxidoreductase alpha subunit